MINDQIFSVTPRLKPLKSLKDFKVDAIQHEKDIGDAPAKKPVAKEPHYLDSHPLDDATKR